MKPVTGITVLAVLVLFTASAAYGGMYGSYGKTTAVEEPMMKKASTLVSVKAGNELIGTTISNRQGDTLGRLSELVKDVSSGSFVYAVIETAGMGASEDKFLAVPFAALEEDFGSATMILDVSKTWLHKAPSFKAGHRPDMADRTWGADIHKIYGQRPYWEKAVDDTYGAPSW